ncbi:hypothetical protein [Comamonas thiooxydans]|uniref:hypothetical protein n=1 Tax=Comamonas thiooxydans TaxID=363952 RepID=UPI00050E49E1|nr:hypothetical protein [Comamonas thiooxydans]KGH23012.1 hypothetical protein P606_13340 [Comamonas thiooxydans]
MPTEEVQSQEDQINAAVVGRGVRLDMGKRVSSASTGQKNPTAIEGVQSDRDRPTASPFKEPVDESFPSIEGLGLMGNDDAAVQKPGRRSGSVAPEDINLMEDELLVRRRLRKKGALSLKNKILGGLGVSAICVLVATNFIPKVKGTPSSSDQQQSANTVSVAPMPTASAKPLMVELSPEEVAMLTAARKQKALSAAAATAVDGDGPLPAELATVRGISTQNSLPVNEVRTQNVGSAAPYVVEVKPGASTIKLPATEHAVASGAAPAAPAKAVDKNSATMDIPLTSNAGVSSDIAGLKEVAERANKAPPTARLAEPLEESKQASKPDSKPVTKVEKKQDEMPAATEALKRQPPAAASPKADVVAVKKVEPEPSKKLEAKAVEKVEKPRPVAKPVKVADESRNAKPVRVDSDVEASSGFALPIREVHANGRPVAPMKPAQQEATREVSTEQKQHSKPAKSGPEVMHVDVAYGLVTNPSTLLPIRVKVGDTLANGAVVSGFDPVKGVINTNRGSYGMK